MRLLRTVAAFGKSVSPPLPSFLRRLVPISGAEGLDPSIYGYILHYSLREQIYLVIATLLSFPFLYYSLDLPKQIVNNAISGKQFPENFLRFGLEQLPYLLVLCGVFLVLVLIIGCFKLLFTLRKGQVVRGMLPRRRDRVSER